MTTMPHIARRNLMIAAGFLLILLLVMLYIPVRIPYSVSAYGRVLSAREWVLVHDGGGQFVSFMRDNGSGMVDEYAVTEQQRGDPTRFHRAPSATASVSVLPGDTIGWLSSSEFDRQFRVLEGSVEIARAALSSARSGEKDALVVQARAALEEARALRDEHANQHRRRLELHEKNIISDDEIEISRDRLRVLDAGVAMAGAQVAAVSSGLKEEDIRVRLAEVAAYESELAALRERARRYVLCTPIGGVLLNTYASDTLLIVRDERLLLMLPIPVDEYGRLQEGAVIDFGIPRTVFRGEARLLEGSHEVQYLQGEPVRFVTAEVVSDPTDLSPGLIARASVPCEPIRIQEYLWRVWISMFE